MSDRHTEGIEKAAEAVWESIQDKGIQGRLFREDCDYVTDAAVTAYLGHAQPVVDSAEELDALPVSVTVLCAAGWPWLHDSDGEGTWWWERPGSEEGYTSDEIELPARVIWWGGGE